jgi:conjugative transfer signal peptidase TraF
VKRLVSGVVLTVWGVFALAGTLALCGARINSSSSLPLGLYWKTNARLEKGALVIFCPPNTPVFREAKARGYIGAGFCPGEYREMIKKVAATKGDRVSISEKGVSVNDVLLSNSKPYSEDRAGRAMPRYETDCTLTETQVLLMSDYDPRSFDARYFGPIDEAQIRSVIRPVLTW